MDYKELLRKYIEHVGESEGVDYIPHTKKEAEQRGYIYRPGSFTDEELEALHEVR
jgi:hypothetical protein